MNQQTFLQRIARLRSLLARQGQTFDVVRFAGDPAYALKVLQPQLDTDDAELLAVCVELIHALGAVFVAPPASFPRNMNGVLVTQAPPLAPYDAHRPLAAR